MEKIEHKIIPVNGIKMHVAELGQGPLVLFIHGFPELWYSWRHQMAFVAARGYRAVAPDMRGYGDTTGAPLDDPSKFTMLHLVGDLISLLDAVAPNEGKVFVVGHDWGAYVAWRLCLYRPDRVRALVNLSVAFSPWNPGMSPVEKFRSLYGDDHYICRFQEPGDIEAEFEKLGTKEVLKNIFAFRTPGPLYFPKGKGFGYSADRAPWLSEEELDYYVTKFEKTGFTGGVNYYRALDINHELNAPWCGAQVKVPAKFLIGELDLTYHVPGTKDYIHKGGFKKFVPLLEDVVVLEGAAHFVNQERPDEINEHIYAFLKQF
ncbi:bifunctional epoxide hydrolase 2 [Phtheirospermum japonicum]|uniref:soluble epoxide hydrolase n=1 Tax=Phtheirospermum japonicum TaxID=374723 RepID=A0A830D4K8_9LAMI|nr:bifunctional epoxide hydrolase 2 [Phtheirospermum japonicum]